MDNGRSKMLNSSKNVIGNYDGIDLDSPDLGGWVFFVPNFATHTQIYASKNLGVFFRELGLL